MSRVLARLGVLCGLALGMLFLGPLSASAHVTVHSSDAVQGGHAEITFRVPTESDAARTVKISVAFPTDTPIGSVSVKPHPGWAYKVTNTPLPAPISDGHGGTINQVVGTIEWSASTMDTAIKPGEYETFTVAAGPLPKTDRVIFKVVQTYDDGTVARWIDLPPAAGSAQPEHPAAVLPLAASTGSDVTEVHAAHTAAPATTSSTGTPAVAWWAMAITGVAVLAALWAGFISVRSVRRKKTGEAAT